MGPKLAGRKEFRHQLFNENGFVLFYPEVRPEDELLQGHPPDPLTESKGQEYPLGTKLMQGERVWRYAKNSSSAITVVGNILQGPAGVHATIEDDIVIANAQDIGDYIVTIDSHGDIDIPPWDTADGGAEGYLYINGGTGVGQCRKIKSHEKLSTTDEALFTLYEPWKVALVAGNSQCGLAENPYSNVVVAAAQAALGPAPPIGVATIALTADYYFWAQSGGPCAVTSANAIAQGTMVVVGTTAGEADPHAAFTTEYIIGVPITPAIQNDDAFLCFLTIDR